MFSTLSSFKEAAAAGSVSEALRTLVAKIPPSAETAVDDPIARARTLAKNAAFSAAALSGAMSLPPGPFGLLTVLPDLLAVWRMQQQLVADIAAAFGKREQLTPETMIICLFEHGSSAETARLLARYGDRVLVRHVAESTLRQLLGKIAIRISQRLAAKGFSRWLPVLGALGVGAYAYYDTSQVAATAIELFSKEIEFVTEKEEARASLQASRRRSAKAKSAASTQSSEKVKPRTRATPRKSTKD